MSTDELPQIAESVAYEIPQPEGYSWSVGAMAPLPNFDKEGRRMVLLCHKDGSVTWELRSKGGEVLEP